jgi:hypothetical protein
MHLHKRNRNSCLLWCGTNMCGGQYAVCGVRHLNACSSVQQCSSVRKYAWPYAAVRQCVRPCEAAWQCVQLCAAVQQCTRLCAAVWQCVRQCAAVWQCVRQCVAECSSAAVCGSVRTNRGNYHGYSCGGTSSSGSSAWRRLP